jgi:hypothetical protein
MFLKKKYDHFIDEKLKELCSENVNCSECFALENKANTGIENHRVAEILRK